MRRSALLRLATLAVAVALIVVLLSRSGDERILKADFPSAVNVVSGAEVRAGGVRIGTVGRIELVGRSARLQLKITDSRVWPLHRGTTAQLRIGGNVSYANRYVELVPGPASAGRLGEGDVLATGDTDAPVEVDELLGTFDGATRKGFEGTIDGAARNLAGRGDDVRGGLRAGGEAFDEAADTLQLATADPAALESLVRQANTTVGALAARRAQLGGAVSGAATTFEALAAGDADLRATLERLPGTLRAARGTLDRVRPTLGRVDALVQDLGPGAKQLRATTPALSVAVGALDRDTPVLRRTLAALRTSAPSVSELLRTARPEGDRLSPVLGRLAPMTACLRTYTPEIVGFFSTWGALTTNYDRGGRFAYLNGQVLPIVPGVSSTSQNVVQTFPQLRYSLVRPTGLNVDQPVFNPDCGTPESSADPANDPESRP